MPMPGEIFNVFRFKGETFAIKVNSQPTVQPSFHEQHR